MVQVMSAARPVSEQAETAPARHLGTVRRAWQPALVFATWLVMTILAWSYVQTYASRVPIWDDIDLVPLIDPDVKWTVKELWGLHNEHRLPLPRMIEAGLFGATRDIRTPMFGEVVLLSGVALASILVARKLRGRTLLADALFPLLWLHTGNHENLLMGFQISIVLPMVVVCSILLFLLTRKQKGLRPHEAWIMGLCLLTLPMCGGQGMAQLPLLFLLLAWFAFVSWRQPEPVLKRGAVHMGVLLALVAALAVCYVIGFQYPEDSRRTFDPLTWFGGALRLSSLMFGLAGQEWWPWSGILVSVLVVSTIALLVWAWRKRPQDRLRVAALALTLGAGLLLAFSIGFGRAGNGLEAAFAVRYIPMPAPILLAAALTWMLYGRGAWSWLVPGSLAVAMVAANVYVNTPLGVSYGTARQSMSNELESDVQNGMDPGHFILSWTGRIHPQPFRLYVLIRQMAKLKLPPFDTVPEVTRERYSWTMMNLPPTRFEGKEPVPRSLNGEWPVLLVPAGCALHFEVPVGWDHVQGTWGMLDAAVQRGRTAGIHLIVSVSAADGEPTHVLFERTIDPVHKGYQRGGQGLRATLPPDQRHLVIEFTWPEGAPHDNDWVFLGDLSFQ
jgi:hypothetical protein